MAIQTVGIAGLGLTGRGMAACLLAHGRKVVACDASEAAYDQARQTIAAGIDELIDRAGFPAALRDTWPDQYQPVSSPADFADCDLAIETIVEDLDAKRAIYREMEQAVAPEAIIVSNTSAFPITTLQHGMSHPERFMGMRWCPPCHVTLFLEVVRGEHTSDATAQAVLDLSRAIGKQPGLVNKDIPGFVINRLGYAMYREAVHLVETGVADIQTIDDLFRNVVGLYASIAGPFRWMDLTGGGPSGYGHVMEGLFSELSNAREVPPFLREKMERGDKSFYNYTEEEFRHWQQRLTEQAWRLRELQDQESGRADKRESEK